jgi:hypothetical protein
MIACLECSADAKAESVPPAVPIGPRVGRHICETTIFELFLLADKRRCERYEYPD